MINIITGIPDSLKSAWLSFFVKQFLDEGTEVISYELTRFADDRVKYFKNIFEIQAMKNCVLILDEAQMFFNSRNWDTMSPSLQFAFQQHRHYGMDIWGAVQNIKRLDIVVRELVSNYYESSKIIGTGTPTPLKPIRYPFALGMLRRFDPLDANLKKRTFKSLKVHLFTKKDFDFYNTLADYKDLVNKQDSNIQMLPVESCRACGRRKILGVKR